jgi:hypothetical protein
MDRFQIGAAEPQQRFSLANSTSVRSRAYCLAAYIKLQGVEMPEIQLATVLPGAIPFKDGNVNETFKGQILLSDRSVKSAIIKDLDLKQLSNELLATVLARGAGLPIPDGYLGIVKGNDLTVSKGPRTEEGYHLVFASVDVKTPNITFRVISSKPDEKIQLLRDILDWGDLGHLYAFDAWIANTDRHPGNLLFGGQNQIWLIDHGHCFSGPSWQSQDLDPNGDFGNRLSEWITPHLTAEQKVRRSSEAASFMADLGSIDIPQSCRERHIPSLMAATDVSAIETFLRDRTPNVQTYANRALGVLV